MCDNKYKYVKIVLWVILVANFLVSAVKLCIGLACNSQSVTADGIHSFSDGASNIVGLIGIRLSSRPGDKKHPYGHGKYEIMASLLIGVMLAYMAIQIISRAVNSFKHPAQLDISIIQGVLMIFTIAINIVVAVTEYRWGRKLGSTILVTDSLHTRGDIFVSCTVLAGLIGIKAGMPVWVDSIMSLAVAIVVVISAASIIKNCVDVLVDSAAVDSEEVRNILSSVPGVENVHKIRSRGGVSHVFIDLHVIVRPDENVIYVHSLSHKLEDILKEHFGSETEVCVHVEPDTRVNVQV